MSAPPITDRLPHELRSLVIALTRACDYNCNCCDLVEPIGGLETVQYLRILEKARAAGLRAVTFGGGNIFEREDVPDLIRFARKQPLKVALETSGQGLDHRTIRALKKAGVGRVDLCFAEKAEKGPPDRDPALSGIAEGALQRLSFHQIPVRIVILVSRRQRPSIAAAIASALDSGADRVVLTRPRPSPNKAWFDLARLDAAELLLLQHQLESLPPKQRKKVILGCGLDFVSLGADPKAQPTSSSCHVARDRLFVDVDGGVYPCRYLANPYTYIGQIQKLDLPAIWERHQLLEEIRDRQNLLGDCWSCPASWRCRGCRAAAYAATGNVMASDPDCPLARPSEVQRWGIEKLRQLHKAWRHLKPDALARRGPAGKA